MQDILRTFLFWTWMLSACAAGIASPPPPSAATTEAPTIIPTTAVPTELPPCGYQWAYQDLPELSSAFQQSIQGLQPEAQANAYAFGENCIGEDGTVVTFLAMETDFNITLQVTDLSNEAALGEWIVKVMKVIEEIPPQQIVGPRPGRVTMTFQSGADQKIVNFYTNQFQDLPAGLSNAEIFQALQVLQ
jgi:hypothetical protein